jgi:cell division protein FtsL
MIRFLNVLAVIGLIASALNAYRIKYDTTYFVEEVARLERELQREREQIAVLRAEWQFLNRPERLQFLAQRHLDLKPLAPTRTIVGVSDIPRRQTDVDAIGRKLVDLGLGAPTETPTAPGAGSTPQGARRP